MSLLSPCKSVSLGLIEGGKLIEGGGFFFCRPLKAFTPHVLYFAQGGGAFCYFIEMGSLLALRGLVLQLEGFT